MAIQLPPVDQKGKTALAIGVALLIGAGAYWYYLYSPAEIEIKKVAAHADTLEAANTKVKQEVADGLEAKLRTDATRYSDELAGLRKLVPTENEVGTLVDAVSIAARSGGMELAEFAPDGVLSGEDFDVLKYRFSVVGPFHKVVELLSTIASTPRILVPINVNIAPAAATLERKPGRDETFVRVQFGVLTYVAKTKAPAAIAPPPSGSKPGTP